MTPGHHDDLKHRHDALLDAIDEHPLHRGDVLDQAGHDVAGRAVVEPRKRERLDVCVEVAAQVVNHPLLEDVVEDDAHRVQAVLANKRRESNPDVGQEQLMLISADHIIDDQLSDGGKNNDQKRTDDGAGQRIAGESAGYRRT